MQRFLCRAVPVPGIGECPCLLSPAAVLFIEEVIVPVAAERRVEVYQVD